MKHRTEFARSHCLHGCHSQPLPIPSPYSHTQLPAISEPTPHACTQTPRAACRTSPFLSPRLCSPRPLGICPQCSWELSTYNDPLGLHQWQPHSEPPPPRPGPGMDAVAVGSVLRSSGQCGGSQVSLQLHRKPSRVSQISSSIHGMSAKLSSSVPPCHPRRGS